MSKILVLKSSIMREQSKTNALIDAFLLARQVNGFVDEIVSYDLSTMNLPILDNALFSALRGMDNQPDERVRNNVELSDKFIEELKACDLLLIGAPMYNLNVPTQLKNWFDLIARANITFRYTSSYPQGLVDGVKAVIITSSGGAHVNKETDALTPYLRAVLGLIGIHDVDFIYAEDMDNQPHGREKGMADARSKIAELAK